MSFHTCVDVGIMIIEYPGCTLVHMLFLDINNGNVEHQEVQKSGRLCKGF